MCGAGPCDTGLTGINDSGQIIGRNNQIIGGTNMPQSFLYTAGTFTPFAFPGAFSTDAKGINDSGEIVGEYRDASGEHAFLYANGSFTTIDVPGAAGTFPYGIDDSGQILGLYQTVDASGVLSSYSFLGTPGNFALLDVNLPGVVFHDPIVQAISGSGQIAGCDSYNPTMCFIGTPGSYTEVDLPKYPTGINDSGQVVGFYLDSNGLYHGYLATPTAVPEPRTLQLLVGCLIALAIAFRTKLVSARPT
jgi:probable HAF family extracellular repeat protein